MKYCLLLSLAAVLLFGCATKKSRPEPLYNSNSLWHLQVGRDYAGQGRYELAKEHLLMAVASSSDPYMRNMLNHELKSVDAMIQTQR